jgi:hypothetical protein
MNFFFIEEKIQCLFKPSKIYAPRCMKPMVLAWCLMVQASRCVLCNSVKEAKDQRWECASRAHHITHINFRGRFARDTLYYNSHHEFLVLILSFPCDDRRKNCVYLLSRCSVEATVSPGVGGVTTWSCATVGGVRDLQSTQRKKQEKRKKWAKRKKAHTSRLFSSSLSLGTPFPRST